MDSQCRPGCNIASVAAACAIEAGCIRFPTAAMPTPKSPPMCSAIVPRRGHTWGACPRPGSHGWNVSAAITPWKPACSARLASSTASRGLTPSTGTTYPTRALTEPPVAIAVRGSLSTLGGGTFVAGGRFRTVVSRGECDQRSAGTRVGEYVGVHTVDRRDQLRRDGLGHRSDGLHLSAREDHDVVAVRCGEVQIVERQDHGQPIAVVTSQVTQKAQGLQLSPYVEMVGWFVEEQQSRLLSQCSGQLYALLLAAGQAFEFPLCQGSHPSPCDRLVDHATSVRTDAPPGLVGDPAEFDRLPRREGELGMVVLLDQSDAACTFVAPQRQQVGSVQQDRWPVR